ncbi:glycosyltransferase family 2 protein [Paraburkholderia sp. CNPSo 3281]|uniref:glycosyltransferase family 2 protein n=1 Tax=Paraburkholderia sp. CNPSo 3281 TaxID=2940933 RepID=UPI0020B66F30|nr:glycosyltransferase family 2 protein [Paraburkholderia sp. CNPSo 3281]MCP3718739.1 glycosyltransferase family 2 protein [Paraburkholderia sp. CNPSo 3281]
MKLSDVRSLVSRVTGGGGLSAAVRKACGVYRREGFVGVRDKLVWLRAGAPGGISQDRYAKWVRLYDQIDDATREAIRARVAGLAHAPRISVIMPVYNPKPEWLAQAIESVRAQLYAHWELCIADDVSTDSAIRPLLERYAHEDERIKVIFRETNGHISAASNSALELVTGEWVALLDHDDLLPEHALYCVAETIGRHPDARMIYSDEDKIDSAGERRDPYFKCSWNPELFASQNMFSHLGVFEKTLLDEVGGFRVGYEGSQDYDLALRCAERVDAAAIQHIPRVLYHWRVHAASTASTAEAKPYAAIAGERALNEHFARRDLDWQAEYLGYGYRVRRALPAQPPLVSLIVPTRNAQALLQQCIDSILQKTTYSNYEIIVVDNGSDEPQTLQYLERLAESARIRVLRDDGPFNYSALNNGAVAQAAGTLVALVNNDIEVITPDWLSEMVALALQPDIGAVGAKLLYAGDTVQHAGLVLGMGSVAGNIGKHFPRAARGYCGRMALVGAFSAVTAACLVVRKSVYQEVRGLNEQDLAVAYNDVDFCLRLGAAGYRSVWTPFAELYHHESATRGQDNDPVRRTRLEREAAYMLQRWGERLTDDPCYSPNLSLMRDDFDLAWPSRVGPLVPHTVARGAAAHMVV